MCIHGGKATAAHIATLSKAKNDLSSYLNEVQTFIRRFENKAMTSTKRECQGLLELEANADIPQLLKVK